MTVPVLQLKTRSEILQVWNLHKFREFLQEKNQSRFMKFSAKLTAYIMCELRLTDLYTAHFFQITLIITAE